MTSTGLRGRHHLHETVLHRAIVHASREAGLNNRATSNALRNSFATHLLDSGADVRTLPVVSYRCPKCGYLKTFAPPV